MQYISPINLLKASLVYGKRLTILCAMHFIGVSLRLSQAADSAEVSYAVALLYLHFAFLQHFGEAVKCFFLRISLRRELKHDGTNKSISRDKYDHFN